MTTDEALSNPSRNLTLFNDFPEEDFFLESRLIGQYIWVLINSLFEIEYTCLPNIYLLNYLL